MLRRARTCSARSASAAARATGALCRLAVLTHMVCAALVVAWHAATCHPDVAAWAATLHERGLLTDANRSLQRAIVLPWCTVIVAWIVAVMLKLTLIDVPLVAWRCSADSCKRCRRCERCRQCERCKRSAADSKKTSVAEESTHADAPPMGKGRSVVARQHHPLHRRKYVSVM